MSENILENKVLLVDVHANTGGLKLLTEAADIEANRGNPKALGVLCGPCADYATKTDNGNFYSEPLWDRVINSEYVKEAIRTKTLFGEIDHPDERLELKAEYAAVNCTKLWKDETKKCVMGCFDILPTEKGRILKSLCDYGSILGVSSRGFGDYTYDAQLGNVVDESSYVFVCFDVVVQPAARKARQTYTSLTEQSSIRKSLMDSLKESINNANCEAELEQVCHLIEKLKLNSKILDKYILEKRNLLKSNDNNPIIKVNKTLTKDLEQAYNKIRMLESQNDSANLMAELSFIRSQIALLKEANNGEVLKEVKKLNKSLKESKAGEGNNQKALYDRITELQNQVLDLTSKLNESDNRQSELAAKNKKLQETVDYAVSFVNKCKAGFAELKESHGNLVKKNTSLATKLQEVQSDYNDLQNKFTTTRAAAEESKRLVQSFREEYIGQKEAIYGSDLSMTKRRVNEAKSLKDIDLIISEMQKTMTNKRPNVLNAMMESSQTNSTTPSNRDENDHGNISVIREALRRNRITQ